jgi:hypothetical protein
VTLAGRRRAAALAAVLAQLLAGCGEDLAARRLRRDARRLTRQNENLRQMIQATSERRLVAAEWLAVAVDEAAVKTVIEAALPQEADIGERWHVQVVKAEVSFRSGSNLVKLDAQVTDKSSPDRIAYVVYEGGLDDIEVGADGRLETRVLIDGVELPAARAAGADAAQLASIASQLAGQNLETLQGLLPAVAIPVRLQQNIAIEGLGDGPVQVDAGELPVKATVARVLPLSGRLWVFLDVEMGPWRDITASPPPPKEVTPTDTKTP